MEVKHIELMNQIPVRLQRSRQHKLVVPNSLPTVYVGRPSKWGNPFVISNSFGHNLKSERKKIIDRYKLWLNGKVKYKVKPPSRFEIITELRGKNLSCWCKLGDVCHADILLEIANT